MKKEEIKGAFPETIQVRTSTELKNKLQSLADKDNRKLADFIRLMLSKLIKG